MSTRGKWRKAVTGLIVGIACLSLTACAPGIDSETGGAGASGPRDKTEQPGKFADGSTMKRIQDRGKLIVGIRLDAPPYAFTNPNTGAVSGFDIEIARLIANGIFGARIEGRVEFLPLDPRDRELALQRNIVDIAMGRYDINLPRLRVIDFAGPYYTTHQSVVAATGSSFSASGERIRTLADLNGKKICTVRGSTNLEAARTAVPQADFSTEKTTVQDCGAAMTAGQAQATIADQVDLAAIQSNVAGSRTYSSITAEKFGLAPLGIGVNKQRVDMRQYVNDRLEVIRKDQRWEDAFERTMPKGVENEQPAVERY